MENNNTNIPQEKATVQLSKENGDTDTSKVSPSISGTDLLEENMVEDLITNTSTRKDKNMLSIFGDLIAGMYKSLNIAVSSMATFVSDLFYKYFSFLKVDISELDNIQSAILIRKKMLLSLVEGVFYLCFLVLIYQQLNKILPFSRLAYYGLIAAFSVCHMSFSLLICNISNAGSDLFKRFNRNDFMAEFAYVKIICSHQLWFFMILALVIGPIFLIINTEFVRETINDTLLLKGFKIWGCYLLILFFYHYSFSLLYCVRRFYTVFVSLGKITKMIDPRNISGRRPTFLPRVLVHILVLMLIMYCLDTIPSYPAIIM